MKYKRLPKKPVPIGRSKDGLYNQKYDYPPETILSHTFFTNYTEEFYKFYKDKMNCLKYEPNITHIKLAELEKKGKLKAVVTQNIDGLHQKAGSKKVYELHGSVLRNYCMKCNKFFKADYIFNSENTPKCECGGTIKPDVVLYEEGLDDEIVKGAINAIQNADLMIVAGTSLTVHPAAGLINYFRGKNLVLINKDTTPFDNRANLVINDSLGKVFKEILDVEKEYEKLAVFNKNKELLEKTVERKKGVELEIGEYIMSVHCWVVDKEGKILMTQRRLDKSNGGRWEPTGGLVTAGENSQKGIKRELYEEIGLNADNYNIELVKEVIEEHLEMSFLRDVYLIHDDVKITDIKFVDGEVFDAKFVTLDEFKEMIKSGEAFEWLEYFEEMYNGII